MHRKNIIILEDHPLIAQTIVSSLSKALFLVTGVYSNKISAMQHPMEIVPDVLLADIRLGKTENSFEILSWFREQFPSIRIVIYTSYPYPWLIIRLDHDNIRFNSLIDKKDIPDWNKVLGNVARGAEYLKPEIKSRIVETRNNETMQAICNLSKRSWQLLFHFARGMSDQEIAQREHRAVASINDHRKKIYHILNISRIGDLMKTLNDWGFNDIEG